MATGDLFAVWSLTKGNKEQRLRHKNMWRNVSVFDDVGKNEWRNIEGEAWSADRKTGCVFRLGGRVREEESRRAFSHERVRELPCPETTDSVESVRFHTPLLYFSFCLHSVFICLPLPCSLLSHRLLSQMAEPSPLLCFKPPAPLLASSTPVSGSGSVSRWF